MLQHYKNNARRAPTCSLYPYTNLVPAHSRQRSLFENIKPLPWHSLHLASFVRPTPLQSLHLYPVPWRPPRPLHAEQTLRSNRSGACVICGLSRDVSEFARSRWRGLGTARRPRGASEWALLGSALDVSEFALSRCWGVGTSRKQRKPSEYVCCGEGRRRGARCEVRESYRIWSLVSW